MRNSIGTVLQVAGLAGIIVATFAVSYTVGLLGVSLVSIFVGLAADR